MKKITNTPTPEKREEIFHFAPNTGAKYIDPSTGKLKFVTKYDVLIRDERTKEAFHFSHKNMSCELLLVLNSHKVQAICSSDPKIRLDAGILLNTPGEDCWFEGVALICVELEKELWCLQYINSTVSPIQNCSIWSHSVCLPEFTALFQRLAVQLRKLSIADFESQLKVEMDKFCPEEEEDDNK